MLSIIWIGQGLCPDNANEISGHGAGVLVSQWGSTTVTMNAVTSWCSYLLPGRKAPITNQPNQHLVSFSKERDPTSICTTYRQQIDLSMLFRDVSMQSAQNVGNMFQCGLCQT